MPSAWRIVRGEHAASAFDGEGARLHGGRWNSRGVPIVYLASSRALALLEVLVHLGDERHLLAEWVLIQVDYPADALSVLEPRKLPSGWRSSPPSRGTQRLGDAWVARGNAHLLQVPSVIVPEEPLLLLNPRSARTRELRIGKPVPIALDTRLGRAR